MTKQEAKQSESTRCRLYPFFAGGEKEEIREREEVTGVAVVMGGSRW